jgi:hypothetical protein
VYEQYKKDVRSIKTREQPGEVALNHSSGSLAGSDGNYQVMHDAIPLEEAPAVTRIQDISIDLLSNALGEMDGYAWMI